MTDELQELLKAMKGESELPPVEEQLKTLQDYMAVPAVQLGDLVVRNKFGMPRYKFPIPNQIAMVTRVYKEPHCDEDNATANTGEISLIVQGGLRTFSVDLRFYEVAK